MTLAWVEDNYAGTSSKRILDIEEFLRLRITDYEWMVELELRRAYITRVPMGLGWLSISTLHRFTMDGCWQMHRQGRSVPLDLVPWEYWNMTTEDALGGDF